MKKILLIIILCPFTPLLAQNYNQQNYYTSVNSMRFTIYSTEYKEGKNKIEAYIKKNNFTITTQNETKDSHHYEFTAHSAQVSAIDSFCQTLGYVSSKNLNSSNNETKLSETKLELERLQNKKAEYEKMLARIDSVKSNRYYEHWEKIRAIDTEIYDTKKKISELESVKDVYGVEINMNDE